MNQFDDYSALGKNLGVEDSELVGVIKLIIYNMRWQTSDTVNKQYGDYKKVRDELFSKYGLEAGQARYGTTSMKYGDKGGLSSYSGNNSDIADHTYTNLNMSGVRPLSVQYYLILSDGTIREISEDKLEMLPAKKSASAIDKLLAAGATEDEVQALANMKYQRFEHSHLLFFSCTSDGIPTVYINTKLSGKIGGITMANPQELVNIAINKYSKNTSLNENKIDSIIDESVKKILNELERKTYANTAKNTLKEESDSNQQWKNELRAFMNGLKNGDYFIDNDTVYVQIWKRMTSQNDPRYVYFRKGDCCLHDDSFYMQNSPRLSTRTLNIINNVLGWNNEDDEY